MAAWIKREREGAAGLLRSKRHAGLSRPPDRRLLPLHALANRLRLTTTRRSAARRLVPLDENPAYIAYTGKSPGYIEVLRRGSSKDERAALEDKLDKCRDPSTVDMVKAHLAKQRGEGEGDDETKAERKRLQREASARANADPFGPSIG
jgi:hypothetical protein